MNGKLIERYRPVIDEICEKNGYDSNISHLLYVIIPAFIYKYKYNDKLILDVFWNVKISINHKRTEFVNAFYTCIPSYNQDKVICRKYVVINNYERIGLVNLLDSLVHEFNHAVNSYNKDMYEKNKILYLRTGLTYITYSLPALTSLKKLDSYVLEEVINTRQTEDIIDSIKNIQNCDMDEIHNIIYALNNETRVKYESNAYFFESKLLKKLLDNKTFMATLENLRMAGAIEDTISWFNNITGVKGSYEEMTLKLRKIMDLEIKLANAKYFKQRYISKIRSLAKDVIYIVDTFYDNCNYV